MPNTKSAQWSLFLQEIEAAYSEAKRRAAAGYDLAERMPPQTEINRLAAKCLALTSEIYGANKSNLAAIYQFLIKTSIAAGLTFYDPLPNIKSADGYVTCIPADEQKLKSTKYMDTVRAPFINEGGKIYRGRSAIDNTITPNIFLTTEGRRLIARQGMMKVVINLLKPIKRLNIENWGQLPQTGKEFIWNEIKSSIPEQNTPDEYVEFVEYVQKNPGGYFNQDINTHVNMLFSGCAQGHIKPLPRATVNNMTVHRYIETKFTRITPLLTVKDGQIIEVRPAGITERAYLRPNEGHYLREYHGMSLTGGAYENLLNHKEIPVDPDAFVRTNLHPDFEWLTAETNIFNTKTSNYEFPVMVGRNSCTGSSIKQTAHNQLVCASLNDIPHYAAINNPNALLELCSIIDLVQVGDKKDAFFIKILTKNLREKSLIEFVQNMILDMQLHFGEKSIDFQIQIIPDGEQFAIIFIPFAMLSQDQGIFTNPTTGATNISEEVPEHLHLGNAAGRWGANEAQRNIWLQDGHASLKRLYDFTALSGTYNFATEYIAKFTSKNEQSMRNKL